MKRAALAIIALVPSFSASALGATARAEPLAAVAHRLGLAYTYLGADDVVTLVGHGVSIVVRPGDPFFTVNARVVPVEGDAPRYQGGDLFISPAFSHQLATIERDAAKSVRPSRALVENPAHINVAAPGGPAHNVTTVRLGAVAHSEALAVSGTATPGSLVAIVLKAISAPDLPEIVIDRSFTVAGEDGAFVSEISPAPVFFTDSQYIVEAAAIDDAKPMSATFTPNEK